MFTLMKQPAGVRELIGVFSQDMRPDVARGLLGNCNENVMNDSVSV